jgi:hypothetical protein
LTISEGGCRQSQSTEIDVVAAQGQNTILSQRTKSTYFVLVDEAV